MKSNVSRDGGSRSNTRRPHQPKRLHYANFIVSTIVNGTTPEIPYPIAVADFGRPVRIYHYRDYTIMIWDKNLLADLGAPRSQ